MQRIVIKNFGAIAHAEIEIKKVVVLIGENATGKSTIIKLISTFLWIEKALFRGSDKKWYEKENRFRNFLLYHRIDGFLRPDSMIEYTGKVYTITYRNGKISIEDLADSKYQLPQIMYIPAERNFITYVRNAKNDLKLSGSLLDFTSEYYHAAENLKGSLSLPVRDYEIEYNKRHEMLYVKNGNHKVKITEAASGIQSVAPLCLVSDFLFRSVQDNNNEEMTSSDIKRFQREINAILHDDNLNEKQKHIAISELSYKLNKKAFINIIEEPEQNLFPLSQAQLIKNLVSLCNQNEDSKLILSTHSPYVLAIINNLILANKAGKSSPDRVIPKVGKSFWLDYDNLFAGRVYDGGVEKILDTEFDLIQMEQIDSVSRVINEEFDFLYQLDNDINADNNARV
jgi:predicted ATP-dependent endonuclease of OLD family